MHIAQSPYVIYVITTPTQAILYLLVNSEYLARPFS